MLRRLEALLCVADLEHSYLLSGSGELIEPDDGILAIGSGGNYALAAARALMTETELSANGIRLLPLTASTPADEIERVAYNAVSPSHLDRDTHITIVADKTVAYATVIAIMKGAERAGYSKLAIGTVQ